MAEDSPENQDAPKTLGDLGPFFYVIPAALVAVFVYGCSQLGGGRDWLQDADDAVDCAQASALVAEYVGSDDDNGLRGSGTHGYLTDRVDQLC